MGLRISTQEAKKRGWISGAEAASIQHAGRQQKRRAMPACCPLDGLDPQSRLWRALLAEYPQAAAERELCWEYTGAVPGRRFRVDILWWTPALAIEVDGYEFHGRIKAGFHRDRQKDRLLSASGWTCVRFSAREISKDLAGVVAELKRLRNQRLPDR